MPLALRSFLMPLLPALALAACQAPADKGDDAERFVGTYTFDAGSHSFMPCGTKVVYPLVPGAQLDELMDAQRTAKGPVVLEILAHRVQGPAAEGEGTDEYLAVDRVVGRKACP